MGWALAELDEDDFAGFTRRYDAELSFELGVSLPPQDRGLSLNPTVGVKHAEVARLSAQFLEVSTGACMVGTTIDTLMRKAEPPADSNGRWTVRHAGDALEEAVAAERVVEDLFTYGEPFLAARSSLGDLIAEVTAGPRNQMDEANLAIAHALRSDMAEAERALAAVERPATPLLAGGVAERFVEAFRRHFHLT
ncbi:hypothetical protein [Micromonospora polyrhachis]|uniref:Uncharacterized protein n=1 Tax=Micromonospora polyrhachis TaxID=1282883 RepID=A0A7W7SU07_9ACTN|nr:hypothetical protein [Micromonospora polyrhachis]MBB4960878.1 hypothetical protein [Micromonospora polyrhachis]